MPCMKLNCAERKTNLQAVNSRIFLHEELVARKIVKYENDINAIMQISNFILCISNGILPR